MSMTRPGLAVSFFTTVLRIGFGSTSISALFHDGTSSRLRFHVDLGSAATAVDVYDKARASGVLFHNDTTNRVRFHFDLSPAYTTVNVTATMENVMSDEYLQNPGTCTWYSFLSKYVSAIDTVVRGNKQGIRGRDFTMNPLFDLIVVAKQPRFPYLIKVVKNKGFVVGKSPRIPYNVENKGFVVKK